MKGPYIFPDNIGEGDYIVFGQLGAYGEVTRTDFNGFDQVIRVELSEKKKKQKSKSGLVFVPRIVLINHMNKLLLKSWDFFHAEESSKTALRITPIRERDIIYPVISSNGRISSRFKD